MPYFVFRWNKRRLRHIADNDVTREEFERVVLSANELIVSKTSGLPSAIGYTQSGRKLFCSFRIVDDLYCVPVTAFEIGRT